MEVLYGTVPYKAIFDGRCPLHKPYPYSLYIGECLHFRYLKCWVIKHIFPGCEPLSFARTPLITNQDISNACFPIHKAGFHIHRAFSSAKQKSGLLQSETMALVMSKKLSWRSLAFGKSSFFTLVCFLIFQVLRYWKNNKQPPTKLYPSKKPTLQF